MFSNQQNQNMSEVEMLHKIMQELDEIKRYVATTYANTDTEISEIKGMCQKLSVKLMRPMHR